MSDPDLDTNALLIGALRPIALDYLAASDEDRPALAEQIVTGLLVGARAEISLSDEDPLE